MRSLAIIGVALCAMPLLPHNPRTVAPVPVVTVNTATCGQIQRLLVTTRAAAQALMVDEAKMHYRVQYSHSQYQHYDQAVEMAKNQGCIR